MSGMYVDRFYEMDAAYEDLIFGDELCEGMIVLLEDSLFRGDPARAFSETDDHSRWERDKCKEINRWCTVTRLLVTPRHDAEPLIRFVGEYPDGTKRVRQYSASYAWFVKRESIPTDGAAS
jgi:hypothetical protein